MPLSDSPIVESSNLILFFSNLILLWLNRRALLEVSLNKSKAIFSASLTFFLLFDAQSTMSMSPAGNKRKKKPEVQKRGSRRMGPATCFLFLSKTTEALPPRLLLIYSTNRDWGMESQTDSWWQKASLSNFDPSGGWKIYKEWYAAVGLSIVSYIVGSFGNFGSDAARVLYFLAFLEPR